MQRRWIGYVIFTVQNYIGKGQTENNDNWIIQILGNIEKEQFNKDRNDRNLLNHANSRPSDLDSHFRNEKMVIIVKKIKMVLKKNNDYLSSGNNMKK